MDQQTPARPTIPRFTLAVLTMAATLIALSQLSSISSFVAPVFFALNLMIAAHPIQTRLARHRVPNWLGAIISGVVVLLVLALLVYGLTYCIIALIQDLPAYSTQFQALYDRVLSLLQKIGLDETQLASKLKGSLSTSSVVGVLSGLLTNVTAASKVILYLLTTVIFLVMDAAGVGERMLRIADQHEDVARGLTTFAEGVRKYWLVTTVFGLIVAVVDYGLLAVLGVPLALVWAMFSFLTNYIPNIGFVIGLIPPALLALIDKGPTRAVWVVVGYCVINFVIQSIIQPRVAGDAVGFTPTVSFISLLLWGWVFGGLGTLMALPLSLLVKCLLVDIDPNARWVNALISSRPRDAVRPKLAPAPSKE